ncbi:MAG: hypothetical protein AB7O38_22165, partial [Pirellulaceae bacterium]
MTIWLSTTTQRYLVHRGPLLWLAAGFSLIAAALVPAVYEWIQPPASRHSVAAELRWAFVFLIGTLAAARLYRYCWDSSQRTLHITRLSPLGWRAHTIPWARIQALELRGWPWPHLGFCWLHVHCLDTSQVTRLPWGLTFGPCSWKAHWQRAAGAAQFCGTAFDAGTEPRSPSQDPRIHQFSLRRLLGSMTAAAGVLAVLRYVGLEPAAAIVVAAYPVVGWLACRRSSARRTTFLAVLLVLYLPLAWIIPANRPWGYTSGLYSFWPLAPAVWFLTL